MSNKAAGRGGPHCNRQVHALPLNAHGGLGGVVASHSAHGTCCPSHAATIAAALGAVCLSSPAAQFTSPGGT